MRDLNFALVGMCSSTFVSLVDFSHLDVFVKNEDETLFEIGNFSNMFVCTLTSLLLCVISCGNFVLEKTGRCSPNSLFNLLFRLLNLKV